MSGQVTLDPASGFIQVRFPYSPLLVELVKRIPRRRWDPVQKVWLVPGDQAEEVVRLLEPRGFTIDPALRGGPGSAPAAPGATPEGAFTVSALNLAVRACLQQAFPRPVWVTGELNRVQIRESGTCWLEVVEKDPAGDGVAASVEGMLFADDLAAVRRRLEAAGDLALADGLEVRLLVQPDLYPRGGRFRVQVRDIDPAFTLGRLAARREEILRELSRLGLLERNRALPVPLLPLRVGLITSWDSNAAHDFLGTLDQSGFAFAVDCYDVRVQGPELEATVAAALGWFAARAASYDVVALVRGGGSPSDLAWFDNLAVALAVARHPLKILVGIGHTQDRSVLDALAWSARTPTAAAEELVALAARQEQELAEGAARLAGLAALPLRREGEGLARDARRLALALGGRLREERAHLLHLARAAGRLAWRRLEGEGRVLTRAAQGMRVHVRLAATPHREALAAAGRALPRQALGLLGREEERLAARARALHLLHPERILERGFALVRDEGGRVLRSAAGLAAGTLVAVELAEGRFSAEVKKIHERRQARES